MGIEDDVMEELGQGIEKSFESLRSDLSRLRTGRASISILDGVRVDYYGTATPLNQCAQLAAPEPRLLTIKPWDKTMLGAVEKALMAADLGLNPQNDGEIIRLPIPQLTEERRKDLVKQAKARGEEAKIAVRAHRRDANEYLKEGEKDKELSQDDLKRALENVQGIIDKAVAQVDETLTSKETEILEI